ncbi:MAG TPA: MFS transporter [Cytophagales bacterium]|nr:MFS transporter [Cytophagales bacterium]HAA24467.1 MFS transporter [Cytophagales bacterium]HAP63043.1 MFS transporter [Cytophagales bacterium]
MKLQGLRWWVLGLVFLATLINYIDRTALSVMWPSISEDLSLNKTDYRDILNVFLVAYAAGQLLSGRLFDKIGTRMGFVVSIGVWGAATMLHAVARSAASFSFFRVLLGLGEAGNWPGAVKSNAEWFPTKERATAQGVFNSGAALGSIVAPPLIASLYLAFGWRATFFGVGVLGLLWIIPWILINKKKPAEHPWISQEEKEYIQKGQPEGDVNPNESKGLTLREILSHRASWSVLMSRFFIEPIWWLFVGWMPIYLFETYGFNVKEIGYFAWVPYVGAAIGSVTGGFYSGRLIEVGHSVNRARKQTITIGGMFMFLGLLATIFFATTPLSFVLLVAIILFGFQFAISNIQTIPSDLFSGKSVGSLAGAGGMVGVGSVIGMNYLVPWLSAYSYTYVFAIIAILVPLGVGALYYFAKDIKPIK